MSKPTILPTGIRRVSTYIATPVETCDHCSAAIKYVSVVEYKDQTRVKLGSKCIETLLNGDTSLLKIFRKNLKLQTQFSLWLEILKRPVDQIPRGSEYFDSGLYFIGDGTGAKTPSGLASRADIHVGRVRDGVKPFRVNGKIEYRPARIAENAGQWIFHPCPDLEKNLSQGKYRLDGKGTRDMRSVGKGAWEPNTPENQRLEAEFKIKQAIEWLEIRLQEVDSFIANTLKKGILSAPSI